MRKGKRLLCLGALISIFCTNTIFGEEYIPPNPLSGSSALLPGGTSLPQAPGTGQQSQPQIPAAQPNGTGIAQPDGTGSAQANQQVEVPSAQQPDQPNGTADIALPTVEAEGAVLIDCATGQVLFEKNSHNQFYPASITKVMTALLTIENCSLTDIVTFSQTATTNLESGAVTLKLTAGDQLTVEQCLYALLLKSANEVANGLAEHMAGSVSAFADQMNARAASLGCTGTHFANPNGLNNETHLTTPYDMALIARAAYANPVLSKISTTASYQMPATKNSGGTVITMGHKMIYPTDSRYYPGMVGGKTGYTSKAKNTLVTCVEQNGVRLVAVVMKASGSHYTDTRAMLDYGFALASAGKLQPVQPGADSPSPGSAESAGAVSPSAGDSGAAAGQSPSAPQGTGQVSAPSSQPGSHSQGPGAANTPVQAGWVQDQIGWYYIKPEGKRAANELLAIKDKDYWFDANAYMATGWREFPGENWYYFHDAGDMAKSTWVNPGGIWYYLGADGVMLKNTKTPDGYTVGSDGAWIQQEAGSW